MDCIELFAGAGGAALGLEAAGIQHRALCEWDSDACATLRAAGLEPVVEGDVRDLDAIEAVAGPTCDLLWSSFPCQAWSTAGKRLGAQDDRNGWPWTVDALDRFKPTWFLGENVRGLLNHRGGCVYAGGVVPMFGSQPSQTCPGCYFERVILRQLRERFKHVGWWLLDAADYGVPQHRRRVILWAGPAPVEKPAPTHGAGMKRPRVSMGEALGLSGRVGSGLKGSEWGTERPAPTLRNGNGTAGLYVKRGPYGFSKLAVVAAGETGEGRPRTMDKAAPTIGTKGTSYLLRPAPTVTAQEVKGTRGRHMHKELGNGKRSGGPDRASDALWLGTGRRRLTVEECARLQDFPADHPWQGTKTAQYLQVGNAVPPTLARVVGEAVVRAAEGEK